MPPKDHSWLLLVAFALCLLILLNGCASVQTAPAVVPCPSVPVQADCKDACPQGDPDALEGAWRAFKECRVERNCFEALAEGWHNEWTKCPDAG